MKLLINSSYLPEFEKKVEEFSGLSEKELAVFETEEIEQSYHFEVHGDTAIVYVHGCIFPTYSAMCWWFGGTCCDELMQVCGYLANHPQIKRIILDIDSPGGLVSGVETCADFIYSLRDKVELVAHVNHMACSAAYWIASACHKIYMAESSSEAGSIGVILTHFSYEKLYSDAGIKVTHIQSSDKKSLGTSYRDLSEEDKKILQSDVDEIFSLFVSRVALYRNLSKEHIINLEAMTYMAGKAIEKKLADGKYSITDLLAKDEEMENEDEANENENEEEANEEETNENEEEANEDEEANDEEMNDDEEANDEEDEEDDDEYEKGKKEGVKEELARQKSIREATLKGSEKLAQQCIENPNCSYEKFLRLQTTQQKKLQEKTKLSNNSKKVKMSRKSGNKKETSFEKQISSFIPERHRKDSSATLKDLFTGC